MKRPPVKPVAVAIKPPSSTIRSPSSDTQPLAQGAYANIDRNTAERFRKGDLRIDAAIDLHGMNREKAYMALSGFLRAHYDQGSRCLLAITGKGQKKQPEKKAAGKEMQQESAQGIVQGVLQELLPRWLAEPGLRPMVLVFDVARPKHGGSGAYYILLRRKR